jgi:hypothetical protein
MMNVEDQLCVLAYAKRLKEMGVKQDSLFVWFAVKPAILKVFYRELLKQSYTHYDKDEDYYECNAAFTASELGALLPSEIRSQKLACIKLDDEWEVSYGLSIEYVRSKTLPNAMARMLMLLIENKLIEVN